MFRTKWRTCGPNMGSPNLNVLRQKRLAWRDLKTKKQPLEPRLTSSRNENSSGHTWPLQFPDTHPAARFIIHSRKSVRASFLRLSRRNTFFSIEPSFCLSELPSQQISHIIQLSLLKLISWQSRSQHDFTSFFTHHSREASTCAP